MSCLLPIKNTFGLRGPDELTQCLLRHMDAGRFQHSPGPVVRKPVPPEAKVQARHNLGNGETSYLRQVVKRHGVASTYFAFLEDNYAQSLSDRRSRHGFPFRIAGQNNVGHDHTQTNVPNRPLRRPSHWPAADRPHADDNARGGWSEHFSVTARRLSAIVQCSEPFRTNRNAHCSEVRDASSLVPSTT
jgi:hypothetical protein